MMRSHLQRLDTMGVADLQLMMQEHSRILTEILTPMRSEVLRSTVPGKESWMALADTVEHDLNRLALARGEELRSALRQHHQRVLRLLDSYRVFVPAKSP
jgi:hypothetical protein